MIVTSMDGAQADMDATLELCHPGNEPSAGRWKDNVDAVRTSGEHANSLKACMSGHILQLQR